MLLFAAAATVPAATAAAATAQSVIHDVACGCLEVCQDLQPTPVQLFTFFCCVAVLLLLLLLLMFTRQGDDPKQPC
jgi:hypothetical protein